MSKRVVFGATALAGAAIAGATIISRVLQRSARRAAARARLLSVEQNRRVLVTGGLGFIGSHTVVELVNDGYVVTIVDNLCNSSIECLRRLHTITGKPEAIEFVKVDLRDEEALDRVFAERPPFGSVIHFAALKAVGESVKLPLAYYENNLTGTFRLLNCMRRHGCAKIIFSSSATVYGSSPSPIREDSPVGQGITNPYGRTKHMMEEVLRDVQKAHPDWSVVLLRYFNPVGAHVSGLIGEDPQGIPNNLMPFIQQVAVGRRPHLSVFGDDYDTHDGTGVRDYIHVVDLARGHLAALKWSFRTESGVGVFNLGTGHGYSVLDMAKAMETVSGRKVPYEIAPRRDGDLAAVYADPSKAEAELGWRAEFDQRRMCEDAWRWQSQNPNGFASSPAPGSS